MQIQIYLPENEHPASGLVRTVVKDSTDLDTAAFLDSDGHYNDNSVRTKANGNPANDGAWHMVCIHLPCPPKYMAALRHHTLVEALTKVA